MLDTAAMELVTTTDCNCGPACLSALSRMPVAPPMAGTMKSSRVVRDVSIGEAVWIIAWTPILYISNVFPHLVVGERGGNIPLTALSKAPAAAISGTDTASKRSA
jgi:hypothetical protein